MARSISLMYPVLLDQSSQPQGDQDSIRVNQPKGGTVMRSSLSLLGPAFEKDRACTKWNKFGLENSSLAI